MTLIDYGNDAVLVSWESFQLCRYLWGLNGNRGILSAFHLLLNQGGLFLDFGKGISGGVSSSNRAGGTSGNLRICLVHRVFVHWQCVGIDSGGDKRTESKNTTKTVSEVLCVIASC